MVSESKFYMWRCLFALIHADDVITPEERDFIKQAFHDIPFSDDQFEILKKDVATPQDPLEMFRGISNPKDQDEFFHFAYNLLWVDGNYHVKEQKVMAKIQQEYDRNKGRNISEDDLDLVLAPRKSEKDNADKEGFEDAIERFKDYFED